MGSIEESFVEETLGRLAHLTSDLTVIVATINVNTPAIDESTREDPR